MRAVGDAQETLSGSNTLPPLPPTLLRYPLSLKRTTASRLLPPRALAMAHGGRSVVAGQPGGNEKFVHWAPAYARMH